MIHRINVFLLSIFLVFSQTFIISTANAGVWNSIKAVSTAGGAAVSGSASIGGAVRTAAANIPWSSLKGAMGKTLKIGGGAASIAIGLALNATDYVMDPANNTIQYKPKDVVTNYACESDGSVCPFSDKLFSVWLPYNDTYTYSNTAQSACVLASNQYIADSAANNNVITVSNINATTTCTFNFYISKTGYSGTATFGISVKSNPSYVPGSSAQDETKTISLPDLIQKLIDQIGNNDAAIKNVLDQILDTMIAEGVANPDADKDIKAAVNTIQNALDANAKYDTANTATGTQTQNPANSSNYDLKVEFPMACQWFAIGCEAAQVVIDFPKTISGYVDAVKEWVKPDTPKEEDTTVDTIPDLTPVPTANYFTWNAYCPFKKDSTPLTMGDQTVQIESDMTSWCDSAVQLRPFVLAAGAIISLMIVSGVYTRNDD